MLARITEIVKKIQGNWSTIHRNLSLDKSPEKKRQNAKDSF